METADYIATLYTDTGHFYIGPDSYVNVLKLVQQDIAADTRILQVYIYEFDPVTSMPAEIDPEWMWSRVS